MSARLLPPVSSPLERALADVAGTLDGVPLPIRDLWNPATCPAELLPWLGWGLSIDFWDAEWSEAEKRGAIAGAIDQHRRKGTRASLRAVLDRFDPLIALVEWFEAQDGMAPHTFRLELPLPADSDVLLDDELVDALLRDITAVKPLRAHFTVVQKLVARAHAYLLGAGLVAGFARLNGETDLAAPADPRWSSYLLTEQGEPLRGGDGAFLEAR